MSEEKQSSRENIISSPTRLSVKEKRAAFQQKSIDDLEKQKRFDDFKAGRQANKSSLDMSNILGDTENAPPSKSSLDSNSSDNQDTEERSVAGDEEGEAQQLSSNNEDTYRTSIIQQMNQIDQIDVSVSAGVSDQELIALTAHKKALIDQLKPHVQSYVTLFMANTLETGTPNIRRHVVYRLNAERTRLYAVMQSGFEAITTQSANAGMAGYLLGSMEPKKRALSAMRVFSDNAALRLSTAADITKRTKDYEATISLITTLSHAFYMMSYYEPLSDTIEIEDQRLQKAIILVMETELKALQDNTNSLIGSQNIHLQRLGTLLKVIAVAMMIALIAAAVVSFYGLTLPAVLMSTLAVLHATTLVTYAASLSTSVFATLGIQVSAAQATTAVVLPTATALGLFGSLAHRKGSPSDLRTQVCLAAENIEQAFAALK